MAMTDSQRDRIVRLYKIQAHGDCWDGETDWWAPGSFANNARQTVLVRKGLLKENLTHGYAYRLTPLGRQTAEEMLAQEGGQRWQ